MLFRSGLGKEQVKQGGVTPIAVKYQGMIYKYSQKNTASKNANNAISQFKKSISAKVKCAAFIAQYDNTTGSIYYKATVDGKELKFKSAEKAREAYVNNQKELASKAITEDFQKYVQTSATEATKDANGEIRYGAQIGRAHV